MPLQPEALAEARDWLTRAERDLLVAHGVAAPKIHELDRLVERCEMINPSFGIFLDTAHTLTPYAVRFRYPGGDLVPPMSEAEEAISLARKVVAYVRQQLESAE